MADLEVHGVLCDMDGTLVDSTAVVDGMWNEFAQAHGLDEAQVRTFAHGRPSRATIARYLSEPAAVEDWMRRIHDMEASRFDGVVEIPGAAAVTRALPPGRWALVTSALRDPARARLSTVGITVPDVVVGADDVERGKPDPEGYLRGARELGIDPRDCVVFEDTEAGVEAGLAAGCAVVVVGTLRSSATAHLPHVDDMTQVTVQIRGERIGLTLAR